MVEEKPEEIVSTTEGELQEPIEVLAPEQETPEGEPEELEETLLAPDRDSLVGYAQDR